MSEGSRANSRSALLEAAFEEFSTKGYEAATVAGIAERAGVTTGAVYAHFGGKLDLLLATVGLTPIPDLARSFAEGREAITPAALGRGLAARPDLRRVLLLDVIVAARRDPQVASTLRGGLEAYVRATADAIGAAAAAGLVAPALPAEAVSRLLAVLNLGMVVLAALDARTPPGRGFEHLAAALLAAPTEAGAGAAGGTAADPLDQVRARAAELSRAQDGLHESLVAAIDAGHSLRSVGAAAGLSHEAVRRIAERAAAG